MPDLRINFARRRTSSRLFPKKGRCVRLDVGEWVAVLNSCEGLRQPEIQSIQQKTAWLNTKRFWFSGCLYNAQRQPETLAPQQRQEWVWRRYAMFCFKLREGLGWLAWRSGVARLKSIALFGFQAASSCTTRQPENMQTAALRNLHRRKRFHHIVHGFHAHEEVF